MRTKGGNGGVVVGWCFLGVGELGSADDGLFDIERCPLPPACSFSSAVIWIKTSWICSSCLEDDRFGCCLLLATRSSILFAYSMLQLIRIFLPIVPRVESARNWLERPNLFVGDHELHLGNYMCGVHRRHRYRSDDRITKIDGNKVSKFYYLCLFHSWELYVT